MANGGAAMAAVFAERGSIPYRRLALHEIMLRTSLATDLSVVSLFILTSTARCRSR